MLWDYEESVLTRRVGEAQPLLLSLNFILWSHCGIPRKPVCSELGGRLFQCLVSLRV